MNKFIPSSFSKLNSTSKIFSKEATKAARQNKAVHKKYKRNKISYEEYQAIRKNCKNIHLMFKRSERADQAAELKISDRNFYQMVASVANISETSVVYFSVKKCRRHFGGGSIFRGQFVSKRFYTFYTFRME